MATSRPAPIKLNGWILLMAVGMSFSSLHGDEVNPLLKKALQTYCFDCHDSALAKGDLDLESIHQSPVTDAPEIWEKVITRLRARQMPPAGKDRPDEATYDRLIRSIAEPIDALSEQHPDPGHAESLRRLNRSEYQNAIRDLLHLEINAAELLPSDESSHGFDNITVGELSPTLLQRYVRAAEKISRLAIGRVSSPQGTTHRIRPDITQERQVPGLPMGTRGGALIHHHFPVSGEYEIRIRLARDRNELIEGLKGSHQLEILMDRSKVGDFTIRPPKNRRDHTKVDAHLKKRIQVQGGLRELGVTFVAQPFSLLETKRQPYESHFNFHRHPRLSPAVYEVSITGPFSPDSNPAPDATESRRAIFVDYPSDEADEDTSAVRILSSLMERAYRRPLQDGDLERPMQFYREARKTEGFEAGIEMALSSILVSPHFLFKIETSPAGATAGTTHPLTGVQLASRLSFFLWSSLPDQTLLDAAVEGKLEDAAERARQVIRMLKDKRSEALVNSFADQWLHLRNLDSFTPNARLFPDFDDNLRQSMRRETELLFESMLREDLSILSLVKSDHTWLNERLAAHYDIPHVKGSHFRKVALRPEDQRGGLLRQGSILTVTSYATRTSPVLRGDWILETLLGTPTPPPPANVPTLEDNTVDASLPIRERLQEHRANRACAVCHDLMDPIGFSLENYDAIGQWRTHENGESLDVAGGLPDGQAFEGIRGLERGLLKRPELFAHAFTEKLMTYALGRGIEPSDAPAIRKIVSKAGTNDYRISSIILGITENIPFTMRKSP